MNALPIIIGSLCVIAIAYRYYSAFIAAKVLALDDSRPVPSQTMYDGHNYYPTNKWVLFGHHFAAISGAGPLIGPVLAAQFGFLPGLLWLVIGVCLGGAVHDFMILAGSVRRKGKSLAEMARTEYESYTKNALVQLRRVRQGTQIEEAHMRNRQMIVRWLMANTKAIDVRRRDGKTFYVMADAAAFREGVGRLLAEVQRIKAVGDYAAAKALFETHGVHFEPALRDEVVARVDKLSLPSYSGFVMPSLALVTDASGAVTDVTISYPMDLTAQML